MFIFVLVNQKDPNDTPLVIPAKTFLGMIDKVRNGEDIHIHEYESWNTNLNFERATDVIGTVTESRRTGASDHSMVKIVFNVFKFKIEPNPNIIPV